MVVTKSADILRVFHGRANNVDRAFVCKHVLFFSASFLLISSVVLAKPVITTRYEYYDIKGSTKQELRDQLRKVGPHRGGETVAYTEHNGSFNYQTGGTGACGVVSYQVTMAIVYHMPRWQQATNSSSPLAQEWNKFVQALQIHEDGHAQNARDTAQAMDKAIADVPAFSDCRRTKSAVVAAAQKAISQCDRLDTDYDQKTMHGIKQGATL